MAQQVGNIFLTCTYDDLTFYQMEGKYYLRKKSRLTREAVKTKPEFALTRVYNDLLVTASKIASAIYADLPKNWRQFWMYRDFTGEAMKIIEGGDTPQQAYDYLWHTYVEYWILYQKTTGIPLETGRTQYTKKPKKYKTRLKHRTAIVKNQRPNNSNRPNKWTLEKQIQKEIQKQQKREKQLTWFRQQAAKTNPLTHPETWSRIMERIEAILIEEWTTHQPANATNKKRSLLQAPG